MARPDAIKASAEKMDVRPSDATTSHDRGNHEKKNLPNVKITHPPSSFKQVEHN
jgi:hypothetical protein